MYSKKVAKQFFESKPSYGYIRDSNNKEHLIPNQKVVDNVRNMFRWFSEGLNLKEIANKLNGLEIETPITYKNIPKRIEKQNYDTVKSILRNRIYTRNIVENINKHLIDKVTFLNK